MADIIKCPVCGENNSASQEFCQYCQSRLQPATGPGRNTDSLIKPGQAPTKKNTAELEPILPQWLKDARDSARQSEPQASSPTKKEEPKPHSDSPVDFLAGLGSQSIDDDEDDTPDWLTNITGATPKPKKAFTETPSEARRVELGDRNDFAQDDEPETPSWLAGLTQNTPQAGEKDELTDWFRSADDSKPLEKPAETPIFDDTFSSVSSIDDTPDWLHQMSADEEAKNSPLSFESSSADTFLPEASDTPDWLRQMASMDDNSAQAENSAPAAPIGEISASDSETPDWLRQMAAADNLASPAASTEMPNAPQGLSVDVPDWLRGLEDKAQSAEAPAWTESALSETEAAASSSKDELPAWMNNQPEQASKPLQDTTPKWLQKEAPASVTGELPAWLSSSEETVRLTGQQAKEQEEPAQDDSLGGLPDWLKAAAPQATLFEEPAQESVSEPVEASFDTPDWLNAFKATGEEAQVEETPSSEKETALDLPSVFASEGQSGEPADNLFTEMPDWLSNAMELPASNTPTPITNTDAISPGELPSWVQAMRPVDAATPSYSSSASFSSDQTLESRGALAGLQGVLPAVPGFTPTSKPKPYSIRLQASDEQQAHAALLEQILAAETAPVPIASYSALRTSRGLRWFLFVVVFAAVIAGLSFGAPLFSMPLGVPREAGRAVEVSRALPQGAPVLVAFDFEASRVGEMEAAAAPFFDQMIFYSHPSFTFISTNEEGSMLAERFISGPLAGHYTNSGFTYSNLGYLPGGQLGIRAFAQNPRRTSPLDIALQPAWASHPDNLTSFSQLFMAMVLVTDNADTARAWLEQTESVRGSLPVVVVSSAQAAPMIQPYFESQQVSGIVAGLYGGAVFEQNNAGTTTTARRYWDAYSLGMLLALFLVVGGGLWNLVLGLRDRALAREAK